MSFDPSLPAFFTQFVDDNISFNWHRHLVVTAEITQSDITELLSKTVEQEYQIDRCRNTGLVIPHQTYKLGQGPKTFTVSPVILDPSP